MCMCGCVYACAHTYVHVFEGVRRTLVLCIIPLTQGLTLNLDLDIFLLASLSDSPVSLTLPIAGA